MNFHQGGLLELHGDDPQYLAWIEARVRKQPKKNPTIPLHTRRHTASLAVNVEVVDRGPVTSFIMSMTGRHPEAQAMAGAAVSALSLCLGAVIERSLNP